jgi:hypothetical protein
VRVVQTAREQREEERRRDSPSCTLRERHMIYRVMRRRCCSAIKKEASSVVIRGLQGGEADLQNDRQRRVRREPVQRAVFSAELGHQLLPPRLVEKPLRRMIGAVSEVGVRVGARVWERVKELEWEWDRPDTASTRCPAACA